MRSATLLHLCVVLPLVGCAPEGAAVSLLPTPWSACALETVTLPEAEAYVGFTAIEAEARLGESHAAASSGDAPVEIDLSWEGTDVSATAFPSEADNAQEGTACEPAVKVAAKGALRMNDGRRERLHGGVTLLRDRALLSLERAHQVEGMTCPCVLGVDAQWAREGEAWTAAGGEVRVVCALDPATDCQQSTDGNNSITEYLLATW